MTLEYWARSSLYPNLLVYAAEMYVAEIYVSEIYICDINVAYEIYAYLCDVYACVWGADCRGKVHPAEVRNTPPGWVHAAEVYVAEIYTCEAYVCEMRVACELSRPVRYMRVWFQIFKI
jgi:hypothetical protein